MESVLPAAAERVSVIMVNYNAGPLLSQSAAAVLAAQSEVELIVVDNASQDGSVAALEQAYGADSRLCVLRNTHNLGFARASNQGLRRASGDVLLLLNPDTEIDPDTLPRLLDILRHYPQVGMVGCRIENEDGSEQRGCRRNLPRLGSGLVKAFPVLGRWARLPPQQRVDLHQQPAPEQPIVVEAISGAFMLTRRAAFNAVGPLDEQYFLHCEDLDWCARFAAAGWSILYVPHLSVRHHQGGCSQSRPQFVLWHKHRGMLIYYRKFLGPGHPALLRGLVVIGIGARWLWLASRQWLRGLVALRAGS